MENELQDKRAQFDEGRKAGKSVKALIIDLGIPKSTAYQWNTAAKDAADEDAAPDSIAPPSVTPASSRSKRGGRRMAVKPISEETAKMLLSGMFFVPAMLQSEPEWLLTPEQKEMLGSPFADALRVIPNPIADVVNTYAAPGVFLSSLLAVVTHKTNRIAQKRLMHSRGAVVPPRGPIGIVRSPASTDSPQANGPIPGAGAPFASAPASSTAGAGIDDVRAAMEAAKGSLTDLDETDAGAATFAQ